MELTVEEVEQAILEILGPASETELDVELGRVMGSLAHPLFQNMDFSERHKLVWDGLREKFGDQAGIGVLLLYSDVEYRQMAS